MRILVALLLLGLLPACSSVTRQSKKTTVLDASQEDTLGGTGVSSADIRSMAERMALDIAQIEWPDNIHPVRIAFTHIKNDTRFVFDPNIIKNRLLIDLMSASRGKNLQFTEDPSRADYFLNAQINALSKGSSEGVSDYLLYTFKILDKANTLVWGNSYETKKQGDVGVMYR